MGYVTDGGCVAFGVGYTFSRRYQELWSFVVGLVFRQGLIWRWYGLVLLGVYLTVWHMREPKKVSFTPRLLRFEQAVGSSVCCCQLYMGKCCTWVLVGSRFLWRPVVSNVGQVCEWYI